jgi:hypothetical protein
MFFKLGAVILSSTDFHLHTTKQHCPSFMGPVVLGTISISLNYDTLKETGNTNAFNCILCILDLPLYEIFIIIFTSPYGSNSFLNKPKYFMKL